MRYSGVRVEDRLGVSGPVGVWAESRSGVPGLAGF